MKIRVVKNASKAQAVQVVRYQNNKRIILQHIGSAHTEVVLNDLMILAEEWIKDNTSQLSIFPLYTRTVRTVVLSFAEGRTPLVNYKRSRLLDYRLAFFIS